MKYRRPLLLVIVFALAVLLSSCSGHQQESPSPTDAKPTEQSSPASQDEEASDSQGDEGDSPSADAGSEQAVSMADHPIVGVWRISYYVTREEVDGTTYETVDEPQQDVYFYFDPRGHYTMSYDELLDFDSLGEDDFDEYWDWRVTGPTTGELGYSDEITTLTLSDDGMLTLHAEFGEDEGRVIPDRVLERVS